MPGNGLPRVVLHPGDYCATRDDVMISTLLGSCVSACLYDPVAHVAGMNHFLLASRRYARKIPMSITEAGRYGIHAMELLMNGMYGLGAEKRRMRAKVFGGGAILESLARDNFLCVNEVNVRFIREFLEAEAIPMEAEDLGGNRGRMIYFRTDTYEVYRKYIVPSVTRKIEKKEHLYWEKEIRDHESEKENIVIFS